MSSVFTSTSAILPGFHHLYYHQHLAYLQYLCFLILYPSSYHQPHIFSGHNLLYYHQRLDSLQGVSSLLTFISYYHQSHVCSGCHHLYYHQYLDFLQDLLYLLFFCMFTIFSMRVQYLFSRRIIIITHTFMDNLTSNFYLFFHRLIKP